MSALYLGDNIDNLRRKCPVCNNNEAKRMCNISYILPEGNPLPRQYDVVCCLKCGFTYANVDASQNIYNDYYENYNMYVEDTLIKSTNIKREARRPIIKLIQENIPLDAAILDVGCGGGDLLVDLKEEGYKNICGMDPTPESISSLKQRGINGFVRNIFSDELPLHTHKYDLVISTAVIEHIYDLHGYLRNIRKYLKEGSGKVILYAPAIEKIDENLPLANYFNHEHINYFSKDSLNNLLLTEGFEASIETTYYKEYGEDVVAGVYRQISVWQEVDLDYDMRAQKAIKNYLQNYKDNNLDSIIQLLFETKLSIVVWGVGSSAMQLLGNYPELLERIKYFVDNNAAKQGVMVCNKPICDPEKIGGENEKIIILICSIKNADDIREEISSKGWDLKNCIISLGDDIG